MSLILFPNPDLVRKGDLLKASQTRALTANECWELLEIERRLNYLLDQRIAEEKRAEDERRANLAHDVETEARAYPTNPSIHDA